MKKILVLLSIVFFIANTNAQSIYIYFNNGNINEYILSTVDKITFSGTNMLLHKTDESVLTWPISDIRKYTYDVSTLVENTIDNNSKMDVLIYPNPSTKDFSIDYKLDKPSEINISILSLNGSLIETILSEKKSKGEYSIKWENKNLKSGIYFIKIRNNNSSETKKVIIL